MADTFKPARNLGNAGLLPVEGTVGRPGRGGYLINWHIVATLPMFLWCGGRYAPRWFRFQTRVLRAGGTGFLTCW